MKLSEACILLLALLNVRNVATAAAAAASNNVQFDVTALKDELRQSACKLVPGRGNDTQTQTFRESVYEKHGQSSSKSQP